MNIFYNRPLFTAFMSFITIFTAAYFVSKTAKYVILALAVLIFVLSIFMLLLPKLARGSKHVLLYSTLCSIAIALACSISLSYYNVKQEKFNSIYGTEQTVEATVLSVEYESEYYRIYTISASRLNGETFKYDSKLICEYGACLQIEFSWASNVEEEKYFVELRGTKAGAYWPNLKIFTEDYGSTVDVAPAVQPKEFDGHGRNLAHFVDVLQGRAEPAFVPQQGVNMIGILIMSSVPYFAGKSLGSPVLKQIEAK